MIIRVATSNDIPALNRLLQNEKHPVFVAADNTGYILGYAFCIFQQKFRDNILTDIKMIDIDDLCADECCRSQHIGTASYKYVLAFARKNCCYNVVLNV